VARSNAVDYFQVYPFWLMDVAPIELLSLPIFTPLLGFSSITAPELTLDVVDVAEANTLFTRKVVKGGSVSSIVLSRAASWYESDFYKWILAAVTGSTGGALPIGGITPRRNLLLIQFLARAPVNVSAATAAGATAAAVAVAAAGANTGGGALGALGNLAAQGAAGVALAKYGPMEIAPRLPGKAWLLYDALPCRYKTGGDFDASSGEISIQELEIAFEYFDEISLFS
jgi:phage tail-like protein